MNKLTRRSALKTIGKGTLLAATSPLSIPPKLQFSDKKHFISLCWDDGFLKSSIKTARIFEKYGLSASFNVVASGHFKSFKQPDKYQITPKGDFVLWNEFQAAGHEVMPHSYKHTNLSQVPFEEAKHLINICLDYFGEHLNGFDAKKSIFHFPYNASTPEIESWLRDKVQSYRTGRAGESGDNALDFKKHLTCTGYGPHSTELHLQKQIDALLARPRGWLIYNTHGLDGEGWGPMRADWLDRLLGTLTEMESVAVLPPAQVQALFM